MTDSSSFTSLMALVDSHLSRTSIQEAGTSHSLSSNIPIPRLTGQGGSLSDTRLPPFAPGQRIGIPTFQFNSSPSPIDSILAEQVSNMLKAKEKKRQEEEEQQRLVEETQRLKLEEEQNDIDLMQALQTPFKPDPKPEVLSNASSLDCLFIPDFSESEQEAPTSTPEPLLPIKTDMSYILRQKIKRGKCSAFGKVLISRQKPVATPYLREVVESSVIPFKFDTPSPCDLIKEKLRKPSSYNAYNFNIFDMI